jgi:hypothetical protein
MIPTDQLLQIRARIAKDATDGNVGAVFAVGHTDADGEVPIREKLHPVVQLLHRWAALDQAHVRLGIHLWTVRIGDTNSVEEILLEPSPVEAKGAKKKK